MVQDHIMRELLKLDNTQYNSFCYILDRETRWLDGFGKLIKYCGVTPGCVGPRSGPYQPGVMPLKPLTLLFQGKFHSKEFLFHSPKHEHSWLIGQCVYMFNVLNWLPGEYKCIMKVYIAKPVQVLRIWKEHSPVWEAWPNIYSGPER